MRGNTEGAVPRPVELREMAFSLSSGKLCAGDFELTISNGSQVGKEGIWAVCPNQKREDGGRWCRCRRRTRPGALTKSTPKNLVRWRWVFCNLRGLLVAVPRGTACGTAAQKMPVPWALVHRTTWY